MNIRRRCLLTLLVATVASTTLADDAAQPATQPATQSATRPSAGWFPGMLHPPRVDVKLPADFTIATLSDKDEWNMYDGVIWSPARTAARYAHQKEKKFTKLEDPLVWVHLSDNVAQEPGTDHFSIEPKIDAIIKTTRLQNATKKKYHWGPYPVLCLTGDRPDGTAFFAAWVGINIEEGWTLFLDYRIPKGQGHPTQAERDLWQQLMEKTTEAK